jgi:hypothetical protein
MPSIVGIDRAIWRFGVVALASVETLFWFGMVILLSITKPSGEAFGDIGRGLVILVLLISFPLVLPALLLGILGRGLVLAAVLAGVASVPFAAIFIIIVLSIVGNGSYS